jgi:hypothetical protein
VFCCVTTVSPFGVSSTLKGCGGNLQKHPTARLDAFMSEVRKHRWRDPAERLIGFTVAYRLQARRGVEGARLFKRPRLPSGLTVG